MHRTSPTRIAIIGASCSGKTTIARNIALTRNIKHLELDHFYWQLNWQKTPSEEFIEKTLEELRTENWVTCGNYPDVKDLILKKADTLIWLDYPFHVIFPRALRRTIKRILLKEKVCNGNINSIKKDFFSKKSILLWVIKDFKVQKKENTMIFREKIYNNQNNSHLNLIHLKCQDHANLYLKTLHSRVISH